MANSQPRLVEEQIVQQAQRQIKAEKSTFRKAKRFLVFGCIIASVVFLTNRPYWLWEQPFDEGVLGTYGDFIGGIFGTFIALYSVYLLVKTLSNQIQVNSNIEITNRNIIDTNKESVKAANKQVAQTTLSVFDSMFNSYMKSYTDATMMYTSGTKKGKEGLDQLVTDFRKEGFRNDVTYLRRTDAAVKAFENFYAKNHVAMSNHLRTLYLLMQLIADKGNIEETDRVIYAKCVRGQLSESEMFILRYNCYTDYGKNMQKYVNRYNLLKHLPTLSLLEFAKWRETIGQHLEYINAVDSFFLQLRKEIIALLISKVAEDQQQKSKSFDLSKRYSVKIEFDKENKKYQFQLSRTLEIRRTGYVGRPDIEYALDSYTIGNLRQMMLDVHSDFFFSNNFRLYNGDNDGQRQRAKITSKKDDSDPDKEIVICNVNSDFPIILKQTQLDDPS